MAARFVPTRDREQHAQLIQQTRALRAAARALVAQAKHYQQRAQDMIDAQFARARRDGDLASGVIHSPDGARAAATPID